MKLRPIRRAALAAAFIVSLQACNGPSKAELLASAKTSIARSDRKTAIIQLKSVLQQDPDSGEARYLLGKALLDSGDAPGAALELRKALDLKVSQDLVAPLLARSLLLQGETRKITDAYGEETLASPDANADLKTTVATAFYGQGKPEMADRALAAALVSVPKYVPAQLLQAKLAAGKRDFHSALELLDSVTAQDPDNGDAWVLAGEIQQFGLHDNAEALADYRKAVALRNDLMAAHQGMVTMLLAAHDTDGATAHVAALKKTLPAHPITRFLEAQIAYVHKDYAGTRALMQPLVQGAPSNPQVLQLAGAAEFRLHSMSQARNLLAQALKFDPALPLARRMLVQTYLSDGEPDKALDLLRAEVTSPQASSEALTLAGQAFMQSGDLGNANEMFSRAARVQPNDANARTALAMGELEANNSATALADLESLSTTDKGTPADLALLSHDLQRNDYDSALKAIARIQAKQPESPLAEDLRGNVLALRGDRAGAAAAFERSLAIDKLYFPAVAGLAALDLQNKQPDAARKRYADLLKADPKNPRAPLALAAILSNTGADPAEVDAQLLAAIKAAPLEPVPRVELVNHYLVTGKTKAALSAAQDAVAAVPDNPDLVNALASAQLADNDFQSALTTFAKLESMQRTSPVAALGQAEAYRGLKNPAGREHSLRHALEIRPDLLPAQRMLVDMLDEQQRYDDALAIARAVQKQHPGDEAGYQLEASVEIARQHWPSAIAALRTGLQKAPGPDVAIRLHQTYLKADRKPDAQAFAAEWVKGNPRDPAFQFYLSDLAMAQQAWPDAEAAYRRILSIKPDDPVALNNLAWLMVKQSKPGALEFAQKAQSLQPNQPALMDTLALALAADNQVPKALELEKKAVQRAPDAASLRLNLARLYIRSGDKAQARTELESLAKLGNKFSDQAQVAELLKGV